MGRRSPILLHRSVYVLRASAKGRSIVAARAVHLANVYKLLLSACAGAGLSDLLFVIRTTSHASVDL